MKKSRNNCDLSSCSFCRGCLKEWLPAIDANRKTFDFKKGELIFTEGEPITGVYFLLTGTAKVHKRWGDDKELIVRFAAGGDILGHRGLGKATNYPVSATALEDLSACFIDLDFFLSSLKVNHEYALNLLMFFAEELQESEKNMRNMAHMQVKERMAYALLQLHERFGLDDQHALNIHLSRHDLASFAGTTYETAFRVMNELAKEGAATISAKGVIIIDENLLREILTAVE